MACRTGLTTKKIRTFVRGQDVQDTKCLQESYRHVLRNTIYEIRLFPSGVGSFAEFASYVEGNYFGEDRRRLWMKPYRQDIYYASMDTNNFVEPWYSQLKSNVLKD
ncbi:hypothetical protein BC939DRAFT_476895 [Gamsiella multidivaricata]|uniref:uncharacterized protein n=1 Tax=Gamsiella multidivaricata TaxID=101098 RepID=UPI002220EF66|nr:uncharacterized protein BC939DRAFT_476895 [Gamsiella multidivaricata]KAI7824098.1 hypothetical protein BC939DRAFT_476895 [Gamsiella multidivaricata]